jgi:hypothetical protein
VAFGVSAALFFKFIHCTVICMDEAAATIAVKAWQANFALATGRTPTREDVASAASKDPALASSYMVVRAALLRKRGLAALSTPAALAAQTTPATPQAVDSSPLQHKRLTHRRLLPGVIRAPTADPTTTRLPPSSDAMADSHHSSALRPGASVVAAIDAAAETLAPQRFRESERPERPSDQKRPAMSKPGHSVIHSTSPAHQAQAIPTNSSATAHASQRRSAVAVSRSELDDASKVETSSNFVASDYRRKYRSKGVKRRRPGLRDVLRDAPYVTMDEAPGGDFDDNHVLASLDPDAADDSSGDDSVDSSAAGVGGAADEDRLSRHGAFSVPTSAEPVYVADILRMERSAGGGGVGRRSFGRWGGGSRNSVSAVSAGIDRAGADADVLDVCLDAIEVVASSASTASASAASDQPGAGARDAALRCPSSPAPAAAAEALSGSARGAALSAASRAVGAVTGVQYSERGLPMCSHRMECRARKVRWGGGAPPASSVCLSCDPSGQVKKAGANKGRWFYGCPCAPELSCNFFLCEFVCDSVCADGGALVTGAIHGAASAVASLGGCREGC